MIEKGKTTYQVLDDFLDVRNRKRAKGVETWVERIGAGCIVVRYHWTDVVKAYSDGSVYFTSGGWNTNTTKERINRYLPYGYQLFQKDYAWYLHTPQGEIRPFHGSDYIVGLGKEKAIAQEQDTESAVAVLVPEVSH